MPYRALVSAARACRPAPLPLLLRRRPARVLLSSLARILVTHARDAPRICATVHHSLTRFPAVTLATSFLIFLPPLPPFLLSFSTVSGRFIAGVSRCLVVLVAALVVVRNAYQEYVMLCQVVDSMGELWSPLFFLLTFKQSSV